MLDAIAEELGKELDPFDLICHVAFDAKPLTRRERAANVKKRAVFNKYGEQARAVLDALLAKYADQGVFNLDDVSVLRIPPLTELGTPVQLINAFAARINSLQPSTTCKPRSTRRPRSPCPFAPSSNPFRISCARTPAWTVTPSASASCAGCSSSRSSTIRTRNWELMQAGYKSPIPKRFRWRVWAADPEGITGDALLAFINNDLFPALKNLRTTANLATVAVWCATYSRTPSTT